MIQATPVSLMRRKNCTSLRIQSISTSTRRSNSAACRPTRIWVRVPAATAADAIIDLRFTIYDLRFTRRRAAKRRLKSGLRRLLQLFEVLSSPPDLKPPGIRVHFDEDEFFSRFAGADIRIAPVIPIFQLYRLRL